MVTFVTYMTAEGASRAVEVLNGTSMPSGRIMLVQYAPPSEELAPAGPATGPDAAAAAVSGGFGSSFNMFPSHSSRASDGSAVGGWENAGMGGAGDAVVGAFSQGWGAAAGRPPYGQGPEGIGSFFGGRGASWDGSGMAGGAAARRPPMFASGAAGRGGVGVGGSSPGLQFGIRPAGGGGIPSPYRSSSPVGGVSAAFPSPTGSSGGRLPPVYMASPVPEFQGGGVTGGASSGLFGRQGQDVLSDSASSRAALLGVSGMQAFRMHGSGFGGFEAAVVAVSEASLQHDEAGGHGNMMSSGHGSQGLLQAAGTSGSNFVTAGSASNLMAASMGLPSAWGSLANWEGGTGIDRQASPAPGLSSHSSAVDSTGRLAGMAEGQSQGSDGGAAEGSA